MKTHHLIIGIIIILFLSLFVLVRTASAESTTVQHTPSANVELSSSVR